MIVNADSEAYFDGQGYNPYDSEVMCIDCDCQDECIRLNRVGCWKRDLVEGAEHQEAVV